MSAISRMDEKEITILANVLSQRRSMFLLELLDPKNQALLSLSGLKKQAAYQLEDMDDEKVREILDEMDKANLESKTIEEINISHKKDRLIK